MKVECNNLKKGVELKINGKKFTVEFPGDIWKNYPEDLKKIYIGNFAFLKSLHLPFFLKNESEIYFNTSSPIFREQIYSALLKNISFCADVDGISTAENLKRFMNLEFNFKDYSLEEPNYTKKLDEKAVISMSFGKDSLLTYAIADEIGLIPELIMSIDIDCELENKYKARAAQKFLKEFKKKVWEIKNNASIIHRYSYWNAPKTEWGYGHLLTELSFNALPFAHLFNAKYILLGNEKSCDDSYINKEGYISYPVYDQSAEWLLELTKMTKCLTNNEVSVVSLIEPIYELAVIKILHKRYPKIGKYQLSCFPDDNHYGKKHWWCQHCSKCARIFIFLRANNINPFVVGFNTDMLQLEYKNLFSLFGIKNGKGISVGYDASKCGRDEQLYAFYLAYKNGTKGDLIEEFKKQYLAEAREREEELHRKFLGIHDSKTIPKKLIKPLYSIYKEELCI